MVAGQLWLYLMSMKQMEIAQPLGAICTFNKIRLVSLHAPGSLEKDGIEAARKQLLANDGCRVNVERESFQKAMHFDLPEKFLEESNRLD
jgi:hypothetical protein